jgi:ActR/RegA family two-component response regulator
MVAIVDARPSLLLVDSDELTLHAVTRLLQARGFDVHAATSCGSALGAAQALQIDVAVVELTLRDGSGIELARRLMRRESPPAVIFYTGVIDVVALDAAAAVAPLLHKPASGEVLTSLLREQLARRSRPI